MGGPPIAVLVALVMGVAVPVLLVVLVRKIWSNRGSGPSGVGNALAEINEMLQPQQPAVEMFQKDVDREEDDDREPK